MDWLFSHLSKKRAVERAEAAAIYTAGVKWTEKTPGFDSRSGDAMT